MPIVQRSPLAEEDCRHIWRYIAADNPDAADRLLLRIESKLGLYAENPGMGHARDRLAPGLRSFPVGAYLVFYRAVPRGIELVRVLHGARKLEDLITP
jgi:toxin ParE1/3/4